MEVLTRIIVTLSLTILPFMMTHCTVLEKRRPEPQGTSPVIANSFASREASHGDAWWIYLEANDPDGDMDKIVCFIQQPGSGHSHGSVYVIEADRARLFGYLGCWISRPRSGVSEWTELTLTVFIRDKGGNVSNKVIFPVGISGGAKQQSPPPPFNAGGLKGLGWIGVGLFHPTE